jgi:hypothetical protein
MINWGLARVSRVFQMVYLLASAPRPINSSHLIISASRAASNRPCRPCRPGLYTHTRMPVTSRVHHHDPPPPRMAGQRRARGSCSQARARAGAGSRTGRCPARCPRPLAPQVGTQCAPTPAAAALRQQRGPGPWPPHRARPQPDRPPAVAAFRPPASRRSGRGSGARAAGRARPFPAVFEWIYGPELEFTEFTVGPKIM